MELVTGYLSDNTGHQPVGEEDWLTLTNKQADRCLFLFSGS